MDIEKEKYDELFYSILTQGEKIKILRSIFDIKQNKLASLVNVSRVFISNVENNKNKLTPNVAKDIRMIFNVMAKEKNINIFLPDNFLMEDHKAQLERIANHKIQILIEKGNIDRFNEICNELIKFISEHKVFDLNRMFKLYEIIITLNIRYYKLEEAKIRIIEALEIASKINQRKLKLRLYSKLSFVYLKLKNYKELIVLKNTVTVEIMKIDDTFEVKNYLKNICYNTAIAYIEIKNYTEALLIIEKLKDFKLFNYKELDVQILKAYCKLKKKEYVGAERLYLQILNKVTAITKDRCMINLEIIKAEVYTGLSELFIEKNDFISAKEYIIKAMKINKVKEIHGLSGMIYKYNFFVECKTNNNFITLKNIFKNTIENREIKNTNLIDSIFYEMFLYCKKCNLKYIPELIDIMISRKNHNLNILINIYCYLKDIDKEISQKILKYCISLNKKILNF